MTIHHFAFAFVCSSVIDQIPQQTVSIALKRTLATGGQTQCAVWTKEYEFRFLFCCKPTCATGYFVVSGFKFEGQANLIVIQIVGFRNIVS